MPGPMMQGMPQMGYGMPQMGYGMPQFAGYDAGGNPVTSDAAKLSIDGASPKPEGYHPGDLNGDGQVDVSDVVLLARFLTEDKDVVISSIGVINADVDGNGNAGIEDVTLMLQYIARIIRVFPVSQRG